jgi:hypothetical protein
VHCMFYTDFMSKPASRHRIPSSLSLRVGAWFEAQATGWGVVALPVVLVVLLTVALLKGATG